MTPTASPTLLVMAAGLGSRYGGLKQLDPVGPSGETIIDYSIYDAVRAGFSKVVFVIRKDIEAAFRETVSARFSSCIDVDCVFQELDSLPPGFTPPPGRTRPWGTAHAVLVAADAIQTPFTVINADDFYGAHSLRLLAQHLSSGSPDYAMVAFPLRNTLSPFGTVSRGICEVDSGGYLHGILERTRIAPDGPHARNTDPDGYITRLTGDELVSMNIWSFTPAIFPQLRAYFARFLTEHPNDLTAEAYLPSFVNALVVAGRARVRVLQTPDPWFGITYREDLPRVAASIRALVAAGHYPERLS
jgi:NDP-sugar pyrophosphorylase family protein